jgi:two-component system chemotaxis response regulator CheY
VSAKPDSTGSEKVIVIDDSQILRQQVASILHGGGYAVVEASDGIEGLEAVEQNPDAVLVLCDINMPRMNGLEFLAALREKKLDRVPVLVVTTEGHPQLIDQARKRGARGWLIKPLKADLLLAATRKIASGKR